MDFCETRYFKCCRNFLLFVGQWPYSRKAIRWSQRVVILCSAVAFFLTQSLRFVTEGFSVDVILDTTPALITLCILVTRYLFYIVNVDLIKDLIHRIEFDWTRLKAKSEFNIIQQHVKKGRLIQVCYISVFSAFTFLFMIMPLLTPALDAIAPLNESRPRFHQYVGEYFVDRQKYFYPILLHIDVSIALGIAIVMATDLPLLLFILHACGMFSLVGYQFEHMFDDLSLTCKDFNENFPAAKRLATYVDDHTRTLEYVKLIGACYMSSAIIQLLLVVILLAVLLLQLFYGLNHQASSVTVMLYGVNICSLSFVMFLCFYPLQMLLDYGSDVFNKAYSGQWYFAPHTAQKTILLVMRRSMESCGLRVFENVQVSFELYASIMKLSVSYFTAFYSLRQ